MSKKEFSEKTRSWKMVNVTLRPNTRVPGYGFHSNSIPDDHEVTWVQGTPFVEIKSLKHKDKRTAVLSLHSLGGWNWVE